MADSRNRGIYPDWGTGDTVHADGVDMRGEKMEEKKDYLEELAKPLVEYLKSNYHPYAAIVITDERVAVVEVTQSIPLIS